MSKFKTNLYSNIHRDKLKISKSKCSSYIMSNKNLNHRNNNNNFQFNQNDLKKGNYNTKNDYQLSIISKNRSYSQNYAQKIKNYPYQKHDQQILKLNTIIFSKYPIVSTRSRFEKHKSKRKKSKNLNNFYGQCDSFRENSKNNKQLFYKRDEKSLENNLKYKNVIKCNKKFNKDDSLEKNEILKKICWKNKEKKDN